MIKLVSFPGINQFRTVVLDVQNSARFVGLDEDKNPIYDENLPKPTLKFTGTVKLHGCFQFNARVKMFDGSAKRINSIKPGDIVLGFDENGNFVPSKVLHKLTNGYAENWIKIKVKHGQMGGDRIITCTPNHKIFVKGKGWVEATNINIDDKLLFTDTYNQLSKKSLEMLTGKILGDAHKLFEDIKEIVPESMQYKLSQEFRGHFVNPEFENSKTAFVSMDGVVTKVISVKTKPMLKHDLETETHNYFVSNVLVHNSQGAVSFNNSDGMWVQSRENIITPLKDNAGFAFFVQSNKQSFENLFERLKDAYDIDLNVYTLTIYGEWVGKNIQKNVAISKLPNKSFFIFGSKVSKLSDNEFQAYWVNSNDLRDTYNSIYNVNDYEKFEIEIDFNDPGASQSKIDALVEQVEKECPVAKEFGISGLGEGIVFKSEYNDDTYIFKAKGLLHAEKKEKVKPDIDNEQIQKLQVLAEKVTPSWRLEQALEKACDFMNGGTLNRKHLGNYIKYVIADVIKEDLDAIAEENVEPKELNKYISEIARDYFFQKEKI